MTDVEKIGYLMSELEVMIQDMNHVKECIDYTPIILENNPENDLYAASRTALTQELLKEFALNFSSDL